jgi:hypothetical protein
LVKPVNSLLASEDFHFPSDFVQQCRCFQRALTSADYGYSLADKPFQIAVLGSVGDKRGRQSTKLRRATRE